MRDGGWKRDGKKGGREPKVKSGRGRGKGLRMAKKEGEKK